MTSQARPNFIDSPFFICEPGAWRLIPGAPREVVREFNSFMAALNMDAPDLGELPLIVPEKG